MDDKKMFSCRFKDCKKSYSTKYSLQRHCLVFHKKSKRFNCRICGKVLSSNQNLKEHLYTHSEEKPLVCPFKDCSKLFRQSSQLSAHKKLHFYTLINSKASRNSNYLKVRFIQLTELLKNPESCESVFYQEETPEWIPMIPRIFEPEVLRISLIERL